VGKRDSGGVARGTGEKGETGERLRLKREYES
jgi:hypothetical protein